MQTPPREELLDLLRSDLRKTGELLPDILPADRSWSSLGLDSLALLEYAARVEQRFRVPIPDAAWKQMRTLTDVAEWLERAVRP